MVFLTIAFQLCSFNLALSEHVSEVMRKDTDLQSALPPVQLEKLVVEPLEAVVGEQGFPSCVIVIDALDECKVENTTLSSLLALSMFADRMFPIKFFITSRPVSKVIEGFVRILSDVEFNRYASMDTECTLEKI